ncbi:hypothetical protein [Falsiroseomonas sp.]|uniref:hypothetical protein n=1 Tax=Falsiroseomonas sp. TaxID=2870721 RepID=UPI003F71F273
MPRALLAVLVCVMLAGCAKSFSDSWAQTTKDQTASSWWSANVGTSMGVGLLANAVPAAHLVGLLADTLYVYSTIDEMIYGNGAIVARERACPRLLEEEDYLLFFAWRGEHRAQVELTLREVYGRKDDLASSVRGVTARLGPAAVMALEKKIEQKVTAKLGAKFAAKMIAKALVGFVPLLGPLSAVAINYWILDGIHVDSIAYFGAKARVVCV